MTIENHSRRQWLKGLAALGLLGFIPRVSSAQGQVVILEGNAWVNGNSVAGKTVFYAGDTIKTGYDSTLIFRHGKDAYLLRANSELVLGLKRSSTGALRLLQGALLGVFSPGRKTIKTSTTTIGIRGTGLYLESQPNEDYICLCYGSIHIKAGKNERIVDTQHHAGHRVLKKHDNTISIEYSGMHNHSDEELIYLEKLVGRTPDFGDKPLM